MAAYVTPLTTLADGTIKQVNPFSGTQVWTVPGRGNRPLGVTMADPKPLSPSDFTSRDAFGSDNKLLTPPEKDRIVATDESYEIISDLLPHQLDETVAEFRRVPNLFEIVTFDYWTANYGYTPPPAVRDRIMRYLSDPAGKEHVLKIVRTRFMASGMSADDVAKLSDEVLLQKAPAYFAGTHDVIIAKRHYVDGAQFDNQLASAGTLTVDEHRALTKFTVHGIADLYRKNRYVRYVVAFQNWLKPAGASFEHLHKQLVAIDEHGESLDEEIAKLRTNPNMYNEWTVDYAARHNLIIAENDHAVAFAGFGHRYPTLEIFSKSDTCEPWQQSETEVNAMSDLVHACHAATGAAVPSNEEWHHRPIDLAEKMPWRIMIKWRVSNLAGFEGGSKIYLNTMSPWDVRDRVVPKLYELRDQGTIASSIRIATECACRPNSLRYNPAVDSTNRLERSFLG